MPESTTLSTAFGVSVAKVNRFWTNLIYLSISSWWVSLAAGLMMMWASSRMLASWLRWLVLTEKPMLRVSSSVRIKRVSGRLKWMDNLPSPAAEGVSNS